MTRKTFTLIAAVVASGVFACAPAVAADLSHADFVKAADAICTKGDAQLNAMFTKAGITSKPTAAQLVKVVPTAVSILNGQVKSIGKLKAPKADKAQVAKTATALKVAIAALGKNPSLMVQTDKLFAEANASAKALGLTVCGTNG